MYNKRLSSIYDKLPKEILHEINQMPVGIKNNIREIRIRNDENVRICTHEGDYLIQCIVDNILLNTTLNNILNYSVYAFKDELKNGYITIQGGHRVGICGKAVYENNEIKTIKNISSLNFRFAHEFPGISDVCINRIISDTKTLNNTLIISPPGCGKTTLLRDIARSLSYKGYKVSICDERSEIAGMYLGKASFDMGPNCDILDGCPKVEGLRSLIRSMSPEVIITDEIGKEPDLAALRDAMCAGVSLITSIHGASLEDVKKSAINPAVENGYFKVLIFLSNNPRTGTITEVLNV